MKRRHVIAVLGISAFACAIGGCAAGTHGVPPSIRRRRPMEPCDGVKPESASICNATANEVSATGATGCERNDELRAAHPEWFDPRVKCLPPQ
jgi:hypothetical protein